MPLISELGEEFSDLMKGLSGANRLTLFGTSGGFQLPVANVVHLAANLDVNSSTSNTAGALGLTLPAAGPYLLVGQLVAGSVSSVNNFITSSLQIDNVLNSNGTVLASRSWNHWISTQTSRIRAHTYIVPFVYDGGADDLAILKINSSQNCVVYASNTSEYAAPAVSFLMALNLTMPTNLLDNS